MSRGAADGLSTCGLIGKVVFGFELLERLRARQIGCKAAADEFTGAFFHPTLAETFFELGGDRGGFLRLRVFTGAQAARGQAKSGEGENKEGQTRVHVMRRLVLRRGDREGNFLFSCRGEIFLLLI